MTTSRDVSPRRLTGKEEGELVAVAERLADADAHAAELLRERDRLILDVTQAGARVSDVANVLGISRNAVYDAITRAKLAD